MMRKAVIFLVVTVIAAAAYAAPALLLPPTPQNLQQGLSSADEGYSPQKGIGYLQAWGFWAKAENGGLVIAQFIVSNTGFQKSFPGYNVTVLPPDGKAVNTYKEFDAKDFSGAADRLEITMPNASVSGAHPTWRVRLDDPELQLNLTFHALCPGLKMGGDGRIKFGKNHEDFFRLVMLAPKAEVTGTIGAGGKSYPFTGWGYADQILQNVLSTSFSKRWFSLRFFNHNVNVVHAGFLPKDEYTPSYAGYTAVVQGNEIKFVTMGGAMKALGIKTDPTSKQTIPTRARFFLDEPGCRLSVPVPYGDFFERIEVLGRLNTVSRKVIGTFFARPFMYRTVGTTTATIDLGDGEKSYPGEVIGQLIVLK